MKEKAKKHHGVTAAALGAGHGARSPLRTRSGSAVPLPSQVLRIQRSVSGAEQRARMGEVGAFLHSGALGWEKGKGREMLILEGRSCSGSASGHSPGTPHTQSWVKHGSPVAEGCGREHWTHGLTPSHPIRNGEGSQEGRVGQLRLGPAAFPAPGV